MKKIFATWLPSLLIICGFGPMIGMFFIASLWGQPELVISVDLAGAPFLIYAYMTVLPVIIPAAILWCYILDSAIAREAKKTSPDPSLKKFFFFSLRLGLFFGCVFVTMLFISALFGEKFLAALQWLIAGILTGLTCSLLCFPFWSRLFASTIFPAEDRG